VPEASPTSVPPVALIEHPLALLRVLIPEIVSWLICSNDVQVEL
jgi:hypothetical protein